MHVSEAGNEGCIVKQPWADALGVVAIGIAAIVLLVAVFAMCHGG